MAFDLDSWATKLAGVGGAAVSLAFIKGTWPERITMAIGGAVVSLYATPWMANKTGMPEGFSGFLLGLFGMAICAKAWELIQVTPISDLWKAAVDGLRKRFGG